MKAVIYTEFGPPDMLQIADIEKPVPKDNEVLVRVRAAWVNPFDWHMIRGTPFLMRAMMAGVHFSLREKELPLPLGEGWGKGPFGSQDAPK